MREYGGFFLYLQIFIDFCRKGPPSGGFLLTFTKEQIKIETEMEVCDR